MIDPHAGDTGNKVETARRCRRLFTAIIGQALKDSTGPDAEIRGDALDYLLDADRSDVLLEAIGIYPYAFRQKVQTGLKTGTLADIADSLRQFYEDSKVECPEDLDEIYCAMDYSKPVDIEATQ